jgi:hypothetical protein
MPKSGLSHIENLILNADITGISAVSLLVEPEEEDNADASASAGSLTNEGVSMLLPENSAIVAEDKNIVTMIKNLDNI